MAATVAVSGISSRPSVALRRSRASVSYSSSLRLVLHCPISSPHLLFSNIHRVQATILQDDEEKVVVEESFKADHFSGKEPLKDPNMSSSISALKAWIIKFEQGVNVFLTPLCQCYTCMRPLAGGEEQII